MTKYLTIAALVSIIAMGGVAWRASSQRDAAQAEADQLARELTTAIRAIEDAKLAAEVHRAHIARLAEEARETARLLAELEQMEGQDAPLSDLLDATADRLWP